MEILYLLIPLSAGLVLLIIGVFAWALHRGQFDDLDREGERILDSHVEPVDNAQRLYSGSPEESRERSRNEGPFPSALTPSGGRRRKSSAGGRLQRPSD